MEEIEAKAQRMLAKLPEWLWDGETLPVPVEHVADTGHGLLIRDVADLSAAPGAPQGSHLSGLLLSDRGEIWVNAAEGQDWPGRRRFTIGHELGTGACTAPTASRCTAARRWSTPRSPRPTSARPARCSRRRPTRSPPRC